MEMEMSDRTTLHQNSKSIEFTTRTNSWSRLLQRVVVLEKKEIHSSFQFPSLEKSAPGRVVNSIDLLFWWRLVLEKKVHSSFQFPSLEKSAPGRVVKKGS